ncbi:alkaline serine protease, subtilase family protein [Fictibacillus macauensis ZFHKF-1]|uniref:Alkaline serine protease, subtilase family protein n=1 Tax=Fictibacillus macauensis ZFHKF-1 TaxID=1196324 RepID=I8AG66_9BACL|nr:S8 family peptidase [Fictibacillus macauensis]EIT84652.1 alkaline serine protease, subtilase family protein [Fictibacillus macauensis ZFHKF-1]
MFKKILTVAATLPIVVSLASPAQAATKPVTKTDVAPKEIIVKFKKGVSSSQVASINSASNVKVVESTKDYKVVKVNGSVDQAIDQLESDKNVEYAEPNYTYKATFTPDDTEFKNQYAPQTIGAEKAWDVTKGSKDVKVAIVDTGVDASHPDLEGKVLKGKDFVDNDDDAMDENKHGTHCAGIAAAATNNGKGIAGMAPDVSVLPVRVLDAQGSGSLDNIAKGIKYAADQGAKVISLSLGGPGSSKTLDDAIEYASQKGAVIVAAAGNESTDKKSYPGANETAIAVAATDENDALADFSNYGDWVDVAAPGVDILSTVPGGKFEKLSGTSMATPLVAGLAGLLASQGKDASQIRKDIEGTADKVDGTGDKFKYGRVNAAKAVAAK